MVFNELSATRPEMVGKIAQNTDLSRERCQLWGWRTISSVVTDTCSLGGFFICGKWAAGGCKQLLTVIYLCVDDNFPFWFIMKITFC